MQANFEWNQFFEHSSEYILQVDEKTFVRLKCGGRFINFDYLLTFSLDCKQTIGFLPHITETKQEDQSHIIEGMYFAIEN